MAVRGDAAFEALVVADYGRSHLVEADSGELFAATRRGKRGDVVVGDRVRCRAAAAQQAVIDDVLPRTSLLYRSDSMRTKELAANVTQVAVVFAPRPPFGERFVWRALIAADAAGLSALLILNKIDLDDTEAAGLALKRLLDLGYKGIAMSVKTQPREAVELMRESCSGEITLLVGQSGMGKSSLINLLVPHANARTQEFSVRLNLGRQTTTHTRWFDFEQGALIDSPGFQSFGIAHLTPEQIADAFPEFRPLRGRCRFLDCRHLREPGCAILHAVAGGAIAGERHAFYADLVQSR